MIVILSLAATTGIFVCFTLSTLLSPNRNWLLLGGFLGSALSCMCFISLFNIFFHSSLLLSLQLYGGLLVFCGFILYDTQLIVEKTRMGDKNYIDHALNLFLDFANVFVRILAILSKDKKKNK
eukprot:TRINITY_DN183_c0_g1_i4.p1 TRINITY_DN183_c0_g1~~TRINITY_DN183_c0_g1_i4.p1  ORF type:complete len:123 (+),score=12.76 TRINITY_DN183_c0_g1_i4:290-658(+)